MFRDSSAIARGKLKPESVRPSGRLVMGWYAEGPSLTLNRLGLSGACIRSQPTPCCLSAICMAHRILRLT
jgi:hypothetical protein